MKGKGRHLFRIMATVSDLALCLICTRIYHINSCCCCCCCQCSGAGTAAAVAAAAVAAAAVAAAAVAAAVNMIKWN